MKAKRTHIAIPEQLISQIDTLVGKRGRSTFLSEAVKKELLHIRKLKSLEAAAGSSNLPRRRVKWLKHLPSINLGEVMITAYALHDLLTTGRKERQRRKHAHYHPEI